MVIARCGLGGEQLYLCCLFRVSHFGCTDEVYDFVTVQGHRKVRFRANRATAPMTGLPGSETAVQLLRSKPYLQYGPCKKIDQRSAL